MFNRRKLLRERLEAYLVYGMLRYRIFFYWAGFAGAVYSIYVLVNNFFIGCLLLLFALFLLAIANSYPFVLHTARWVSWFVTLILKE